MGAHFFPLPLDPAIPRVQGSRAPAGSRDPAGLNSAHNVTRPAPNPGLGVGPTASGGGEKGVGPAADGSERSTACATTARP